MKQLTIITFLILFTSSLYAGQIIPRLSIDLPGTNTFSQGGASVNGNTDMGFGIGAEYLAQLDRYVAVGGGFEYQFGRELSKVGLVSANFGNFYYVPVYVTGKLFIAKQLAPKYDPFLKLNLGYNVIYGGDDTFKAGASLSGGFYFGIGAGVMLNKYLDLELMYSSYAGEESFSGLSQDDSYGKFGLSVGYAFDFLGKWGINPKDASPIVKR
jgi:hypothetical protein